MNARIITIYTDASVCSETNAGGWACWIKSAPGETVLFSGAFKTAVKCTTDAELRAIANGVAHAKKLFGDEKVILVIVTDSQGALDIVTGKNPDWKKPKRKNFLSDAGFKAKLVRYEQRQVNVAIGKSIREMLPEGWEIRVNKVKAHNGRRDGARSYVNNLVDKAARKSMREAREAKKA